MMPRSRPALALALTLSAAYFASPAHARDDAGLSRHPFLYCGEYEHDAAQQTLHVVRDGREVWSYGIPFHVIRGGKSDIQELGDCTMLSNGNIVFTTRFGAAEITPAKTIVWQYLAPDGTEIHSLQAIGRDRVLLTQNGKPAQALLIDKPSNTIVSGFTVPVADPDSVHGQLRRVHLTRAGTYLVAQMDMGKVIEYDRGGKSIWSVDIHSPWDAVRLRNGNTLISSNDGLVREVDPAGRTLWEYGRADASAAGVDLRNVQEVTRLANGNTLITNWVAGTIKPDQWPRTVQAIEVTPAKKIVWTLSSWSRPRLGPATSIQLLDEPGKAEDGALQR